jgi:hypothetical protein
MDAGVMGVPRAVWGALTAAGNQLPAGLERGYQRLLAWYPWSFRAEHGQEMLGVLMATARPGQQRPTLPDTADIARSALIMRARSLFDGHLRQGWPDALAVLSVTIPLFLLAVDALMVALPYRMPISPGHVTSHIPGLSFQIPTGITAGGPQLLSQHGFILFVISDAVIAVLALAGFRRIALAAVAAAVIAAAFNWPAVTGYTNDLLKELSAPGFLLEAVALAAPPGPAGPGGGC